jgi:hypothetical protein
MLAMGLRNTHTVLIVGGKNIDIGAMSTGSYCNLRDRFQYFSSVQALTLNDVFGSRLWENPRCGTPFKNSTSPEARRATIGMGEMVLAHPVF